MNGDSYRLNQSKRRSRCNNADPNRRRLIPQAITKNRRGPVVTCVGIGWRVFGRHEGIRSCGEVNDLIVWFLGEGVPSVDLAHDDLS